MDGLLCHKEYRNWSSLIRIVNKSLNSVGNSSCSGHKLYTFFRYPVSNQKGLQFIRRMNYNEKDQQKEEQV